MSEDNSKDEEKPYDPTPNRLQKARESGDAPRSADAAAAAAYLGFLIALLAIGAEAAARFAGALAPFIGSVDQLEGRVLGPGGLKLTAYAIGDAAGAALPLLLAPAVLALAAYLAQRAFTIAPEKLTPKFSRLSLMENARKKFGVSGLVEFAKTAIKLSLIAVALAMVLWARAPTLPGMMSAPPRALPGEMTEGLVALLSVVTAIAAAIGLLDLIWQRYDHARRLRMSHKEMKEEAKQTEGDPEIKQRRARRAREIATNRMLAEVPKADVVIVNPTHYAVALKWTRATGAAPVCVAKGADEIAARIREAAALAGVPVRRDPPTARAIHATVELGREISPEHYRAVAAALRFAAEMRRRAKERGWS